MSDYKEKITSDTRILSRALMGAVGEAEPRLHLAEGFVGGFFDALSRTIAYLCLHCKSVERREEVRKSLMKSAELGMSLVGPQVDQIIAYSDSQTAKGDA